MKRRLRCRLCAGAALAALTGCALAGPLAYITNQGSHDVSVLDVDAGNVVAALPAGRSPAGVWVSEAAGRAFVSSPDSASITVIDLATRKPVGDIRAGRSPVGITVTPEFFDKALGEEMERVKDELGAEAYEAGRFPEAIDLFRSLSLAPQFEDFLTVPAYKLIA